MERVWIMRRFVVKLRASGYIQSTIREILKSGLRFYYRKLRIDLEGGPALNKRDDSNDVSRKRAKLGASERWFRRRRGGEDEVQKNKHGWRREPKMPRDPMSRDPRGPRSMRTNHGSGSAPTAPNAAQPSEEGGGEEGEGGTTSSAAAGNITSTHAGSRGRGRRLLHGRGGGGVPIGLKGKVNGKGGGD